MVMYAEVAVTGFESGKDAMRRGGDSALLLLDGSMDNADMGLRPRVKLESGIEVAYGFFGRADH
jgi:hypothetical protein